MNTVFLSLLAYILFFGSGCFWGLTAMALTDRPKRPRKAVLYALLGMIYILTGFLVVSVAVQIS